MNEHEITLRGYRAGNKNGCDILRLGTNGSYGVERLHLVPDGDWEGLTITAVFHAPDGTAIQVLADGGTVDVPPEATAAAGRGKVIFIGSAQGQQRISCDLAYNVLGHAVAEGTEPAGPAPSWYEQAAAHFLPDGGKAGQVLAKASDADLDVEWADGGNGTADHAKLSNRDASDQHPISAITGLETALDAKQPAGSYLTQESDPTVPDWAKQPAKPAYTADEVGADAAGTAQSRVAAHNTVADAHADIRLLIQQLADRLNALADSDDTTLDQLSEIVAYIKSNRDLISAVTTDKVSVADIIDNLTTNVAGKPLSAAQGVALKALIDAITVPTALPNPNALTFTGAVTGSYDGSKAVSVEIPSGGGGGSSGGSGKAKSQILIDQEITELTASLSVTLEHDFHNLTAIITCGSAGAALTADSDGTAVASKIGLLIDTTSFGYNSRKVAYANIPSTTWQTRMIGAEWSDDLSVFKRGFKVDIATGTSTKYYDFPFGGASAMYGTLETDDNSPRTGKTANIVVNGAYLNVGTKVVLWGEYYE